MIDPYDEDSDWPLGDDELDDAEGRVHILKLTNIPDDAEVRTTEIVTGTTVTVVTTILDAIPHTAQIDGNPFGAGVVDGRKFNAEQSLRDFDPRRN